MKSQEPSGKFNNTLFKPLRQKTLQAVIRRGDVVPNDRGGNAIELFGAGKSMAAGERVPDTTPEMTIRGASRGAHRRRQIVVQAIGQGAAIDQAEKIDQFPVRTNVEEAPFQRERQSVKIDLVQIGRYGFELPSPFNPTPVRGVHE